MDDDRIGAPVRVIVVDANAFPRGEPSVKTVAAWATACEQNGAEFWVPEAVALELAEHAIAVSRELSKTVEEHNSRRALWGLSKLPVPPVVTAEQILEELEQAGAVVVETTGDAARSALRDQILTEGPGAVVQGVKTGASDSAWIRVVLELNTWGAGLVVVSSDKGAMGFLRRLCAEENLMEPTVVASLGEIRELIQESSLASETQVRAFLLELPDRPDYTPELVSRIDLGRRDWWNRPRAMSFHQRWEEQTRTFEIQRAPELTTEVTYDGWTSAMSGRVRFPVVVTEQYVSLKSDEVVTMDDFYDAWIEGDVVVSRDEDGDWAWTEFDNVELVE